MLSGEVPPRYERTKESDTPGWDSRAGTAFGENGALKSQFRFKPCEIRKQSVVYVPVAVSKSVALNGEYGMLSSNPFLQSTEKCACWQSQMATYAEKIRPFPYIQEDGKGRQIGVISTLMDGGGDGSKIDNTGAFERPAGR